MSRWAPSVTWSLALGLGALALDRLHKLLQLDVIGWHGGETVTLTPFFDYVLVWNTGISYGLLGGLPAEGLLAIMVAAMALLVIWWWRDKSFLTRIGIALAIGGAVSNALDRVIWGAVADFFHFHAFGWSFYVFNIADVAISAGVVLLIVDVLWPNRRRGDSAQQTAGAANPDSGHGADNGL